jgi:uncharacterized protein (TIRG00374 family)
VRRKLNKTVLFLLKLSVSGALLYLVLSRAGIERVVSLISGINPWAFAAAVVIYIAAQFLASVRWSLLLKDRFSLRRLFPLYLLGSFFNTFMPGLVGGDVMKIYYLYKETGKGTQSLASVFMDRYIGLTSLMSIGLIAFPFGIRYFGGSWILWLLPAIVLGYLVASLLIFGLRLGKGIKRLNKIYDYFHSYRKERALLLKALMLSAVIQSVIILSIYILALGLGQDLPLHMLFVFIPIIATLSSAPISISGIGIREASTVLLLGTIGVKPDMATAISFAWFLSIATGGLSGLYEYLRVKEWKTSGAEEQAG